jgi:hypothetical protein
MLFKTSSSERRKQSSKMFTMAKLTSGLSTGGSGSKECKAHSEAIEQFQKDKTQFQVFFTQIAGKDDAAELIELFNDVSMFLTVPSDMIEDMVCYK